MSTEETMNTSEETEADSGILIRVVCTEEGPGGMAAEHVVRVSWEGEPEHCTFTATADGAETGTGESLEAAVMRLALARGWRLVEMVEDGGSTSDELVRVALSMEQVAVIRVWGRCKDALKAAEATLRAAGSDADPVLAARVEGMRAMFQVVAQPLSGAGMAGAIAVLAGRSLVALRTAR